MELQCVVKGRRLSKFHVKVGSGRHLVKRLLFVVFLTVLLPSCQGEETTENLPPEEVALQYVKYTYSMNRKGLERLLCKNCDTQPYNRTNIMKRDLAYEYEADNVDFYDPEAYDFNDMKCAISSQNKSVVNLICKGRVVLFRKDRSEKQTWDSDRKVTLYHESGRLTICPPVCNQTKGQ